MLLLGILCAFWALPAVLSLGLYPRLDPPLYGYNPFNVSIIPLTKIGCTHPHLNATEVYKAKEKLVDWGKKGKIPAGGIRGQYSGKSTPILLLIITLFTCSTVWFPISCFWGYLQHQPPLLWFM